MSKTRTLIASAFLMFASAASASATIQNVAHDPARASVTYDDLDLKSPKGVARLQHRIRSAAQQVCIEEESGSGLINPMADQSECYRVAVASGMSQLNEIASQ
jgi:UrcA family protein